MGKYEKKVPFWKKAGAAVLEMLGELLIMAVFFLIGAGILILLGNKEAIADMDPECPYCWALWRLLPFLVSFSRWWPSLGKRRKRNRHGPISTPLTGREKSLPVFYVFFHMDICAVLLDNR